MKLDINKHAILTTFDAEERNKRVSAEFERLGISPFFLCSVNLKNTCASIEGVDTSRCHYSPAQMRGAFGCRFGHFQIVQWAQRHDWDHVFVFENDIAFAPEFCEGLEEANRLLPQTFDVCLLGYRFHGQGQNKLTRFNERFLQIKEGEDSVDIAGAHAYVVNKHHYDYMLRTINSKFMPMDVLIMQTKETYLIDKPIVLLNETSAVSTLL